MTKNLMTQNFKKMLFIKIHKIQKSVLVFFNFSTNFIKNHVRS